jgi:hypothetical protein
LVQLDDEPAELLTIWRALVELAATTTDGWTLIGAQMVRLHALRAERAPRSLSADGDIAVSVPRVYATVERFVALLEELGFQLDGASPEGIGHRFVRDGVKLDVLASGPLRPEHANEKLRTTAGARTLIVPGAVQALARSELVEVSLDGARAALPCPSLLGAILIKARAVEVDDVPDAQRHDVAFLCDLVGDPDPLADEITNAQRSWLRRRTELADPNSVYWRGRPDGYVAFQTLTAVR